MLKEFGIEFKHKEFLQETRIEQLMKETPTKKMISATDKTRLCDLLQILHENLILSAPIYDSNTLQLRGLVDVLDITSYITWETGDEKKDLSDLLENRTVGDLMEKVWRTKDIYTIPHSENLYTVIKGFLDYKKHRAIAVDPLRKEMVIISQTDLIKFLLNHAKEIGLVLQTRLEDLNLVNPLGQAVHHIFTTDTALDGFRKISHEGIHGLAILDENKKLVGNLSASDLRGINPESMSLVQKPVLEFLDKMGRKFKPVEVKSRTLLEQVMTAAIGAKVHRVWVTNENQIPVGLISMTDMLCPFVN